MHVCAFSISLRISAVQEVCNLESRKIHCLMREVVNVLASQSGESSSGYSVFIGREESGKEGEFLRQNPGCNRWP